MTEDHEDLSPESPDQGIYYLLYKTFPCVFFPLLKKSSVPETFE